jgi:lambda family phage minor tail protein L
MSIQHLVSTLEPGTLVELFQLDLTMFEGGDRLYFHNDTVVGGIITFQGIDYSAWEMSVEGFEGNTSGQLPRPKVNVGNIGAAITALCRQYDDLRGAQFTRLRTLERYLDGQPGADPTQIMGLEIWVVDRKANEDWQQCSFELSSANDVQGVTLPRGRMNATICATEYRGAEACLYTGVPKTDGFGQPFTGLTTDAGAWNLFGTYTTGQYAYTILTNGTRKYYVCKLSAPPGTSILDTAHWTADVCLKKITDCKIHYPGGAPLPMAAFPGCNKLPQ